MTDGTRRTRIRASFEAGKCIWPGCKRATAGCPEQYLCWEHLSDIFARADLRWEEARKARNANRAARLAADPGNIYYLRAGGHYKIGWSRNLSSRLRTAYAPDTQILAVHPGSRDDERSLHRRFAHLRAAGDEWYPLVPDITHHIQVMIETHGQPDPVLRCGPKPTEVRRPSIGRNGPSPRYWTGSRSA